MSTLSSTADARQSLFLHLRGERVRLAIELLDHEVEPPADGLVAMQNRLHLRDVAREPIDLFGDVGALRDQRELLLQALRVRLHVEPLQALAQPLAVAQLHAVELRLDAGDERRDARVALLEHLRDARALAAARLRAARAAPRAKQPLTASPSSSTFCAGSSSTPGQRSTSCAVSGLRLAETRARTRSSSERSRSSAPATIVSADRAALVGADLQRAIDLAALDRGRDELAAFGLDGAQLVGQAEAELQEPVIDAANLPNEPERPYARFRRRESGHAVRHSIESGGGFSQSERRSALRNRVYISEFAARLRASSMRRSATTTRG